jgi:Bacterial regulatory helix-turn-helix protein, lysR family
MDLQQLRCFVVTAEELHFGRAAQKLGMMPSALGRHIKLLEEELATRLIDRTTRSVALTGDGAILLDHVRALLADAAGLESRFRTSGRKQSVTLRLGSIDSAAVGLVVWFPVSCTIFGRSVRTSKYDCLKRKLFVFCHSCSRAGLISLWFAPLKFPIRSSNSYFCSTRLP